MFEFVYASLIFSIMIPIILISIILLFKYLHYRNSSYKDASKNSFFKTIFNKGNNGEFLSFSYLEKIDIYKRLMTNLYLPKQDGTTTEIDLIMITFTGIYVFESKNYSGWIYGDERNKNWTQTLKNNKKNQFYNPIWQNRGHINALKTIIGVNDDEIFKSIIVFSERCELKKIDIFTTSIKVIKRNFLINTIKEDIENSKKLLSLDEIERFYLKLQDFTCVDERTKETHIRSIKGEG